MALSKTRPVHLYGKAIGDAIRARIADVLAARNVAELPLWSAISGQPTRFALPAGDGCSLIFESNHTSDREALLGTTINWRRVTGVQLLEVRCNG